MEEFPPDKHRILYNSEAANALSELMKPGMDVAQVKAVVAESIDELADAGVDTFTVVMGARFFSTLGPSNVLEIRSDIHEGFGRLIEAGIDPRKLMADLCHRRGMEFLACIRMNDRHTIPVGSFVRDNPDLQLAELDGTSMDFVHAPVRAKLLEFIEELLGEVEVDGLDFDYMRWCFMFRPGQGAGHADLLTDFTLAARRLLDEAAARSGRRRLILGVRVPQTVEECDDLGLDVAAWIREGAVDYVVPSDFFYTDLNTKVEQYVKLAEGTNCKIYPAIHPVTQNDDDVGINDLSNYRAAARNFYAHGASGLEAYNYAYHWGRRIGRNTPWPAYMWPSALGYLGKLADPQAVASGDRHYRYYPLWAGRAAVTGAKKDDRIMLDRASDGAHGSQRFRMAEDLSNPKLLAIVQFKAVGLDEQEALDIRLNGEPVPSKYVTRHFDHDGQTKWEGRPLDPFYFYTIDLGRGPLPVPMIDGDNDLTVRLLSGNNEGKGTVIIDELEVYIYVRG